MNCGRKKRIQRGRQMKRFREISGISFGAGILLCAGLALILPDHAYSVQEKRNLAQLPPISPGAIADGSFMNDMEEYAADQFPGRNVWMMVKTSLDRALGQNESQGIFLCSEGYLMEAFEQPDADNQMETINSIADFSKTYVSSNMYLLLVPNAVSVYEELLPDYAPTEDQNSYMDTFFDALSSCMTCIDVRAAFQEAKEATPLYYRTDHHWTTQGAWLAYQCAANVMNLTDEMRYTDSVICNDFSGSLASASGFIPKQKDSIRVFLPDESRETVFYTVTYEQEMEKAASCYQTACLDSDDPYQVFFGGNHAVMTIDTSLDSERSLLILKDSYANCFIPFLINEYRTITVIDPRYYYDNIDILMKTNAYTDVLFLYNVNTLAADTNLKTVLINEQ